jgi:hypothetical protein
MDRGQEKVSRRELLKSGLRIVGAVALGDFLASCAASPDIVVGVDFNTLPTSDGKKLTLDFSDIKRRADSLTMPALGPGRLPVSPRDASPYPIIPMKNGKPSVVPHDVAASGWLTGQVVDSLVLEKVKISENLKELNKKGEVENIGLYPTSRGPRLTDTGRKPIDIKNNDAEYYVLRVVMAKDISFIEDSDKIPAFIPQTDSTKPDLLAGCLVFDLNGVALGFESDFRAWDIVK